jgi:hypothetical protein
MEVQPMRQGHQNKTILISIRLNHREREQLARYASECDMGLSSYIRSTALKYHPKSHVDLNTVLELIRLRGDLGRLGGLLKLWLADDYKAYYANKINIPVLLEKTLALQEQIGTLAKKL